jgi:superfamily II helicase
MASDPENLETAADRLEVALERIAQAAAHEQAIGKDQIASVNTEELAARLDGLIDRLRAALGDRPG